MTGRAHPLRARPFRLLFASRTVSMLGNAIAPVALAFAVLSLGGATATTLGLILFARAVAQVACFVLAGVVADRLPRYRVMVAAELLAGLTQLTVALLFLRHGAVVGVIAALEVVNGAAEAFFLPASTGVVPQVVAAEQLQPANAMLRMSINASSIVGAAIAGTLVATAGPGWALFADAMTFFASALLLAGMRVPHLPRTERSTVLADLRHGWREFTSRQWVWVIVIAAAVINACFFGTTEVLGPVVALRSLGGAPAWAAILATTAAGLLIGSFVAFRVRPRHPMRLGMIAIMVFCVPLFLLAGPAPVWLIAAGGLVMGVSADVFGVLWDTGLQTHVPQESLSRVSSYDMLGSFALGPVGLAVVGPVADAVGTRATLLGSGVIVVLCCVGALALPQVRNLRAAPVPS